MQSIKSKKTLVFIGLAAAVLTFAGSVAYNNDLMVFENDFGLTADISEFSETFESPSNWAPCTETPKTAIATNRGTGNRYVRMKIDQYWRTANSTTPDSDHTTTDLSLTWEDDSETKSYAVLNLQNQDDWYYENGWYYYLTPVASGASTNSLLKSVTFNCDVNTVQSVDYSDDGKSAESTPTAYAGAKFHAYITFQMSQEPFEGD